MATIPEPNDVFDKSHHASSVFQKLRRSLELGPKYYALDLPRYLRGRRSLNLRPWDWKALVSPIREFRSKPTIQLPLPPGYPQALERLHEAGASLTIPRNRLEGLLGVWWSTRVLPGDTIECGSYRGATSLLLGLLDRVNGIERTTFMLDTFAGMPATSRHDLSRREGEFLPSGDAIARIREQASILGVGDRVEVCQGLFCDTFKTFEKRNLKFAFVHIDANIYQGTLDACQFTIPRMSAGGAAVFDDYNGPCDLGARLAIDQFFSGRNVRLLPLAGSSVWLRV
jgi:hypothetical protein